MRDLHSSMFLLQAIGNATLDADNVPVTIDLQGYDGAEILLAIGAGGIVFSPVNKIEFVLSHSDDDAAYDPVTDIDMLGVTGIANGIIKSLVADHPNAANYRMGYKGSRRYLQLLADFSGTHGVGTPIYASVLGGRPNLGPQADQA